MSSSIWRLLNSFKRSCCRRSAIRAPRYSVSKALVRASTDCREPGKRRFTPTSMAESARAGSPVRRSTWSANARMRDLARRLISRLRRSIWAASTTSRASPSAAFSISSSSVSSAPDARGVSSRRCSSDTTASVSSSDRSPAASRMIRGQSSVAMCAAFSRERENW